MTSVTRHANRLDIQHVRSFALVARELNITRAAGLLHMSQQAVSLDAEPTEAAVLWLPGAPQELITRLVSMARRATGWTGQRLPGAARDSPEREEQP